MSITKPGARGLAAALLGEEVERARRALDGLGADEDDAGRIALVDLGGRERVVVAGGPAGGERGLLDDGRRPGLAVSVKERHSRRADHTADERADERDRYEF